MPGRATQILVVIGILVLVAACAGPDDRDDSDATNTPTEQPTLAEPTPSSTEPAATEPAAEDATATDEAATATEAASPTSSPTVAPPTPTDEPTATTTPTPVPVDLEESLPGAEELPGGGFFLANQGTLSALDLANSYQDSSAHLERLDDWGFQEHIFREFSHDPAGADEQLPFYVLTTVNVYGSDEQATEALDWLRSLNASQGQVFVDPDPDLADGAFASSVETAEGTSTAIVYVQIGPSVYAYFAQGGEALDFVLDLATANTEAILDPGEEDTGG